MVYSLQRRFQNEVMRSSRSRKQVRKFCLHQVDVNYLLQFLPFRIIVSESLQASDASTGFSMIWNFKKGSQLHAWKESMA